MKNFDHPYAATGIQEFWKRWHISLSTWFKDYLYIPLGGNRTKVYRNLLITFVVSGLWHGANWTFVAWGAIHGIFLIMEYSLRLKSTSNPILIFLRWILTFSVVCFGWIFFRANSIQDAISIITSISDISIYSIKQLSLNLVPVVKNSVYPIDLLLSYFLVSLLFIIEFLFNRRFNFNSLNYGFKLLVYTVAVIMIYLMGVFDNNEFIYFQF